MSLNKVPLKEEMMGWDPQSLSDFMEKLKLSGCDKVVTKGSITGAQFMQMSLRDLQVFPSLYLITLSNIQREINKEEQMGAYGHKYYPIQHTHVWAENKDTWKSDLFVKDSEYECLDQEQSDNGYICAMIMPETAEYEDDNMNCESNLEHLAYACTVKSPQHQPDAKIKDYPARARETTERISKPQIPHHSSMSHSHKRTLKTPADQSKLHNDKSKKPLPPLPSPEAFPTLKGSLVKAPGSSTSKINQPSSYKPRDVPNRINKHKPPPPIPRQPAKVSSSIPAQILHPSWYRGKVTRHQGEVTLRQMNKDGAFLVRDSLKDFADHPYSLMLLKQGRIYNIKIRNQGNSYSLGNGTNNTKSFPGVKELITHHTHAPLLLTDGQDQRPEVENKCCLLYPAGL